MSFPFDGLSHILIPLRDWSWAVLTNGNGAGRLTTHVLDVTRGKPAAGMRIDLYYWGAETASHILTVKTNADGRCDAPLLSGQALKAGEYELRFHAGDYLKQSGAPVSSPPFLDLIPVRFGISDPLAHYHVPLLISAHGYSTYRGS